MTALPFQILAGSEAYSRIQSEGFHPGLFNALIGASGGPKWFVLSRLDRMLASQFFAGRSEPIACMGSSIGSWRHVCYAQQQADTALARLEHCYIHQHYNSDKPKRHEVSQVAADCVDYILGENGAAEIVDNPVWQSHILAVRSGRLVTSDNTVALALGLGGSALANAVSRQNLGAFFQRALFYSGKKPAFTFGEFKPEYIPLSQANIPQAILASGSIPLVMNGVDNISGAPPGVYRDGGITDYHFDFSFQHPDGLVLYPHFYSHITPGWYDKALRWRRLSGKALTRVVIIAPSDEFVAALPHGKIPDRNDFNALSEQQRIKSWTQVCEHSEHIAEAFYKAWQNQSLASLVQQL